MGNTVTCYQEKKSLEIERPDFALYSKGAKVINRYTSETFELWPPKWYQRLFAQISGHGVLRGKSPITAISPDTYVGQCWPFPGREGQLAILLSQPVYVTAVTYDHVSKDAGFDILSAPKDFEVWGIIDDGIGGKTNQPDNNGYEEEFIESRVLLDSKNFATMDDSSPLRHFLGRFIYDINGSPVQTFEISNQILKSNKPIKAIIMRVLGNWGKPLYTCLYRFRVHGDPVNHDENLFLSTDKQEL
ncbi:21219_t:CDS:1 [Dentiscutata erythropus]|uniref:21219_t:CDS:1 n=1 Tax=Dentiscutata erythropus TaxID=1348616 RepID=A0A9N8Z362_9GLOM|nr:21219_t:CDS:1 [Dentiscutata erythropus]